MTPSRRLALTYNGEIYNYVELRAELAVARPGPSAQRRHRGRPPRLRRVGRGLRRAFRRHVGLRDAGPAARLACSSPAIASGSSRSTTRAKPITAFRLRDQGAFAPPLRSRPSRTRRRVTRFLSTRAATRRSGPIFDGIVGLPAAHNLVVELDDPVQAPPSPLLAACRPTCRQRDEDPRPFRELLATRFGSTPAATSRRQLPEWRSRLVVDRLPCRRASPRRPDSRATPMRHSATCRSTALTRSEHFMEAVVGRTGVEHDLRDARLTASSARRCRRSCTSRTSPSAQRASRPSGSSSARHARRASR